MYPWALHGKTSSITDSVDINEPELFHQGYQKEYFPSANATHQVMEGMIK